jgi:AMP nucleosidase
MVPEGVKTEASDQKVSSNYVNTHISLGIEALEEIRSEGLSVRHLKF